MENPTWSAGNRYVCHPNPNSTELCVLEILAVTSDGVWALVDETSILAHKGKTVHHAFEVAKASYDIVATFPTFTPVGAEG